MAQTKITSTIKKVSFSFTKAKIMAELILSGLDKHQIYQKFFHENLMEIYSDERRQEITNQIYIRLMQLDNYLMKEFVSSDIITAKFILIYAISKNDILFTDFLSEVYRGTLLSEKKYISMDDFDKFFISKKETYLEVNAWSRKTIELLSKGYRKMLIDSSLGIRKIKNIYIEKLIIHPAVMKHLKQIGDYKYLQAILGEK